MQSSTDISISQPSTKIESDIQASNGRTLIQTIAASPIVQSSTTPFSQTSTSISPPVITPARIEKPSNGTPVVTQNNRFVAAAPLTITHLPKGTAAVANITVPRGKLATPIIRGSPVPHVQPSTTTVTNTTQGFVPTLSRPVTTWVVTTTSSSPALLQKTTGLNVVSSTYAKPPTTLTVTSRIATPVVTKATELAVKPIILHSSPKQLLTQPSSQLPDRNPGGVLKTNLGMVTIRGAALASSLPTQNRLAVPAQSTQPKLTVAVPMLVPTSNAVRKPQILAPKVIPQPARAPFTVQSIPVSVSHTPSALTMNKKTAGITIGNNQASIATQNTCPVVRATPTMVATNSLISVTEIPVRPPEVRPVAPTANLVIQATTSKPPQNAVPTNSNLTAFTAPTKPFMYDADNFQVKRTLVSSATTAFTSTVTTFTTTAVPRHFITSSVTNNQLPRNPIMVVETPRLATSVTPSSPTSVQPPTLAIQPYVIPPVLGTAIGPVQAQLPQSLMQSQVPLQQLPPSQTSQPPSHLQRLSPLPQQPIAVIKPNQSPRPSILRKRDFDSSLAKAQRNLTPLLNSTPSTSSTSVPSPPASPHMPDMGGGQSSNSSSTLSATSSPGIPNIDPDSPTPKAERPQINVQNDDLECVRMTATLIEMSPRKKPRKQQLIATTSIEPKLDDDMEFICDDKIKKEPKDISDALPNNQEYQKSSSSSSTSSSKKPNISILTGYNHGWKSRHHHFMRHTDVKYKEEKKPSVSDIANQKYVTQKINGWKLYHLSAQMEDLHDIEIEVVDKLSSLLKLFTHSAEGDDSKNLNRTNELIMGNLQRSKVVSDQLKEAKTQILKVFNHKKHVSELINKYASKRTIKKKGRY